MIRVGALINDRYEILEKVGSGGMSIVYKAKDIKLGRFVAIKILRDEYCHDDEFVAKFKVEAQAAASLSHPNIVNIYDVGNDHKVYFIVMELLEGPTLKEHIKQAGMLTNAETIRIGACIASALDHAHNNHIFHRDIKPQNIIISPEGLVKVADFGIARIATSATIPAADMASGSVHYIPPEQAKGGYTNEKSDLYSLGITMFEMLTGRVPFEGDSAVSVALKQIHDNLPDILTLNPEADHNLTQIIRKATQKNEQLRYASAEAMLNDLKTASNMPKEDFVKLTTFDSSADTMVMNTSQMRHIWNESEILAEKNKGIETGVVVAGIVSAIIAVSFIVFFVFSQFKEDLLPVQITIPNIVGEDIVKASNQLNQLGLAYQITDQVYSDSAPKDVIMAQSIEAETLVSEGTIIELKVSLGQELYPVPTLTGLSYDVAEELVENASMVSKLEQTYDDYVPIGAVISQYPEPGNMLIKGSEIIVYVSLGKEAKYVTVPDGTNKSLDEATGLLRAAGLTVSDNISYAFNDVVPEGSVIAMTVPAGERVKEGYVVDLTVSKGKEIKEVVKYIEINDILDIDEDSAILEVLLIQNGVSLTVYDSIVSHEDFDPPLKIEVSGLGEATYEVYKDGNLEYTHGIVFSEEN